MEGAGGDGVKALIERVRNEPALFAGLVSMLLITVQEFGLNLTDGQETALNGLTVAVLAFAVRRKVVPERNTVPLDDVLPETVDL